ncbi:MAG: 2-oxoacid:acceptor oxidoreductase family protein [Thermoplasmatota archaeon]
MKDISKDVFTYIIGGKAGEGINKAGDAASNLFSKEFKRNVFNIIDYQSLIRGGHNFSVVSTSTRDLASHYMKADLIINLDERSLNKHKDHLAKDGLMINNSDKIEEEGGVGLPFSGTAKDYSRPNLILGVSGIAVLTSILGLDKEQMKGFVEKEYSRGAKENVEFAEKIYDMSKEKKLWKKFELDYGENTGPVVSGNESISLGAASAGLDMYIGYPMTPASSILHFFARHVDDLQVMTVHPESEIAVANLAIGGTITGARTMVGTSGGGMALMEEAFSLAGMAESPVLFIVSSRPGPSTGVPTYTEQGDLNFALHQGHGEFPKIVSSPGSIEEAFYLSSEMLNLVWKFQTPGILLSEKHLSESGMTVDLDPESTSWAEPKKHDDGEYKRYLDTEDGVSPLLFPPSNEVIKWSSKEHDEKGISTERPEIITKMHDKRGRKMDAIVDHLKEINTVNYYGDGGPTIFTYGSTTMSVLEALKYGNIDATVVQPIYLKPFPVWELNDFEGKDVIAVEQSSIGQFATLLKDKINVKINNNIKKYDGRAFEPIPLAAKIKEVI